MRFVDTNILLYAVSTVAQEKEKHDRALAILDANDIALSVQVLQEFYVQATRSSKPERLTHEQSVTLIESWLRYHVQEITTVTLQNALATRARWNISYWDAAIVEAARIARCDILLSEDFQHGMDFAGIRIVNPFRTEK